MFTKLIKKGLISEKQNLNIAMPWLWLVTGASTMGLEHSCSPLA
jgi:hypothetical protein